MSLPSVVRLTRYVRVVSRFGFVRCTRKNVLLRDSYQCQYCGVKKEARELNYDHVIPRVQGGKTVWDNIVASCYACNSTKRGRTPEQAGMKLLRAPVKPKWLPPAPVMGLSERRIPVAWAGYCASSG